MKIVAKKIKSIHFWDKRAYLFLVNGRRIILDDVESYLVDVVSKNNWDITSARNELVIENNIKCDEVNKILSVFFDKYAEYFEISDSIENMNVVRTGEYNRTFPYTVILYLTNNCYHNCKHCFKGIRTTINNLEYKSVADFLKKSVGKVAKVQLTGGEPLLYPNFENILLEYGDNYEFVITTSAYHIKASTLNALKKAKLVQVSLYSFNTTQTDIFMENPGACQNIVQNIRRLLDTGIRVRVSNMVTPENVDNLQEFIEECIKLGVKEVTFGKVASIGNAANHPELLLNSYQFQKACDILRQMEQVYGKLIKIDTWDECPVQEMKGSIFTCDAGTMSWTVLENGDIQPCSLVNDTKLRMGSIYDEQSTNLSNSKEIKKLHARWSSYDEIVQWHAICDNIKIMG